MTPDELESAITRGKADLCLSLVMRATETERRGAAKAASNMYKRVLRRSSDDIIGSRVPGVRVERYEQFKAASVAVLGTATLGEIKRIRDGAGLAIEHSYEILARRRPDWLQDWAEWV